VSTPTKPSRRRSLQAGVLKGDVKDILFARRHAPVAGIETKGQIMTKLIERNTTIPTKRSEVFTTADDNQPSVEIRCSRRERHGVPEQVAGHLPARRHPACTARRAAGRGHVRHRRNGIVHVSAKDLGTGQEQKMTITVHALGKDEIERMMKEAEATPRGPHPPRGGGDPQQLRLARVPDREAPADQADKVQPTTRRRWTPRSRS